MYRPSRARSFAAIFTTLSLLTFSFILPAVANAQAANTCQISDTECTDAKVGKPCTCLPVTDAVVAGLCTAPKTCTVETINGTAISKLTLTPAQLQGYGITPPSTSVFSGIGSFLKENPILAMGGLMIGSTLLTSLLTPSATTPSSGSSASTAGVCTTAYYQSSVPSSDPCAVYEPGSTPATTVSTSGTTCDDVCQLLQTLNGSTTTPTININNTPPGTTLPTNCPVVISPVCGLGYTLQSGGTDLNGCALAGTCVASINYSATSSVITTPNCPVVLIPSCSSGEVLQNNGVDNNGCEVAPTCIASASTSTVPASCPVYTVQCVSGYVLESNGVDSNNCPLPDTCVAANATPTSASSALSASPTSGTAPLEVTFTTANIPGIVIFGDGNEGILEAQSCTSSSPVSCTYTTSDTYQSAGTYIATLTGATNTTLGSATITVNAAESTASPVPVSQLLTTPSNYVDITTNTTPAPSQTPLNQPLSQQLPPDGLHGSIATFGGGATVFASNRDSTSNTEVAGFFGSDSGSAQGAVGSLCQARPWASNFLSYVIPPSFFDSLCSAAGYNGASAQSSNVPQNTPSNTITTVALPAPVTAATTSNSGVQAQVKIWANPPSVSLGGRTTIFWTSVGVSSCTESSSDGNFSGSSTSGGASTVALSGPVTFTMQCEALDGAPISDSTTVNIGI